jgi:hypothetical protein
MALKNIRQPKHYFNSMCPDMDNQISLAMCTHGHIWAPMGTYGHTHGYSWILGTHGYPWIPMCFHRYPWIYMVIPMGSP